ncbi:unnamed protein product [Hanseniaspora opuntiae]
MFKDMRIKKNHSSTEKASLNTSPSSTSVHLQNNINFFNSSIKRKSIDSEASIESLRESLPVIKGTVTHEWGTSSSKKKNNTIIKLNNTDGTPLTSPLKMTSVNSNENMDIETLFDDKHVTIPDYKFNTSTHDKSEIEQKRKHNRAARILSNEQFLNIQVDSVEDEKMIEKIHNGNLFQSPIKKGTILKKNNLTLVSENANSKIRNLLDSTDEESEEESNELFKKQFDDSKTLLNESSNKKIDTPFVFKKPQHQYPPSLFRENSGNNTKNNRERSASATNSVNSEASDMSESSQFSFQFKGRTASVKYYSKNKNNNEMNYFDDVIDEDFDLNNGLSDDDFLNDDENYPNDEQNQIDESDECEDTFGMGFSTIAQISEQSSEEDGHSINDEEEHVFGRGLSSIANIADEEEDTIADSYFGERIQKKQEMGKLPELKTNLSNDAQDDSLVTPNAESVNNNIKKFNDLFDISDDEDVDDTPKVVKIKSNDNSKKPNKVTKYNDLFSLSESDEEEENSESIKSPACAKRYMFSSSLDDYDDELALSPNTPSNKILSPVYSNILTKSPMVSQKKKYGYAQFYGMNSISAIYDDPLSTSPLVQSPKANLVNLPPRNILKYHDLNTDLDSSIPRRMGDLFFIEEEDEDAMKNETLHLRAANKDESINDDTVLEDDLVLAEINEIPEDYDEEDYVENTRYHKNSYSLKNKKSNLSLRSFTISEGEDEKFDDKSEGFEKMVPKRLFGNKQKMKYHKFFHKPVGLVARSDKPMSNKVSIKNKTITFFKKHLEDTVETHDNQHDVDLSPIQEKRVSLEE